MIHLLPGEGGREGEGVRWRVEREFKGREGIKEEGEWERDGRKGNEREGRGIGVRKMGRGEGGMGKEGRGMCEREEEE